MRLLTILIFAVPLLAQTDAVTTDIAKLQADYATAQANLAAATNQINGLQAQVTALASQVAANSAFVNFFPASTQAQVAAIIAANANLAPGALPTSFAAMLTWVGTGLPNQIETPPVPTPTGLVKQVAATIPPPEDG